MGILALAFWLILSALGSLGVPIGELKLALPWLQLIAGVLLAMWPWYRGP